VTDIIVIVSENCLYISLTYLHVSSLIIEKEQRIVELEMSEERYNDTQVDTGKLLETMHSDKTALSRSTAQNKELKSQLAELQGQFVKMVACGNVWFLLQ